MQEKADSTSRWDKWRLSEGVQANALLLLGSVLYVALVIVLLPNVYAEADDPGIVFLLRHNAIVPFMTILSSRMLGGLYQLNGDLPWYALILYGMLATIFAVTLNIIKTSSLSNRWALGITFFLAIFFSNFITKLTYTEVSILLAGFGMLGFLNLLRQHFLNESTAPAQFSKWLVPQLLLPTLGYGLMVALAYLTRWEGVKSLVFLTPLMLCFAWQFLAKAAKNIKAVAKLSAIFLLPFAMALFLNATLFSMTPQEKIYDDYLQEAGKLIGHSMSVIHQRPENLNKVGWTKVDYEMFRRWFYFDDEKFSTRNLTTLVATSSGYMDDMALHILTPGALRYNLVQTFDSCWFKLNKVSFGFAAMALLLIVLIINRYPKKELAVALGYVAAFFGMVFIVVAFLRFPERVGLPLYFVMTLSFLLIPRYSWAGLAKISHSSQNRKITYCLLTVCALLTLIGSFITFSKLGKITRETKAFTQNRQYIFSVLSSHPDSFMIRSAGQMLNHKIDPLLANPIALADMGPGWLLHSPPYMQRLQEVGIQSLSGVLPWLAGHENGYFLVNPSDRDLILAYYATNYPQFGKLRFRKVGQLPAFPNTELYRLERILSLTRIEK